MWTDLEGPGQWDGHLRMKGHGKAPPHEPALTCALGSTRSTMAFSSSMRNTPPRMLRLVHEPNMTL